MVTIEDSAHLYIVSMCAVASQQKRKKKIQKINIVLATMRCCLKSLKKGVRIMAIYHYNMQMIKRSEGRNAVACAAYRSGETLVDESTGFTKDYPRDVQPIAFILAPENAPKWVYDRQKLWSEVEKVEKRKDSQLAREINIALPVELSNEQQEKLVREFVSDNFVSNGMIADVAIHRDDINNPHFHVMLTTRHIDENGFGKKQENGILVLRMYRTEEVLLLKLIQLFMLVKCGLSMLINL